MAKLATISLQNLGFQFFTEGLVGLGPVVKPDIGNLLSTLQAQQIGIANQQIKPKDFRNQV